MPKGLFGATVNLNSANSYDNCGAGGGGGPCDICNANMFDSYVSTGLATPINPARSVQKIYFTAGNFSINAQWTTYVNNGGKVFLSCKPSKTLGSQDTAFSNALSTLVSRWGTANFKICLWQEMDDPADGFTNASYKNYAQYYYDLVKSVNSNIKVVFDPTGDDSRNTGFYPGDAYVDEISVDYYGSRYIHNNRLDGMEALADNHKPNPIPFGLAEWGNSSSGTKITNAQWTDYTNYLATFYSDRAKAGKSNGWIIHFDTGGGGTLATNGITGPSDPQIPGFQHFFITTASQAGGSSASHSGDFTPHLTRTSVTLSGKVIKRGSLDITIPPIFPALSGGGTTTGTVPFKIAGTSILTPNAGGGTAKASEDFSGGTNGAAITTTNTGFDITAVGDPLHGTDTFSNAHAHSGTLSNYINTDATGTTVFNSWTTKLGSVTQVWFKLYLYLTAYPANQFRIFTARSGFVTRGAILVRTNGQIGLYNGPTQVLLSDVANPIALNQWVRIEGFVLSDAALGQIEVKIFNSPESGVPTTTATTPANLAMAGPLDRVDFGMNAANPSISAWIDDVAVSTTGYIGASGSVSNLIPVTAPTTAGDPVVVSVGIGSSGTPPECTGVSDTKGNSYLLVNSQQQPTLNIYKAAGATKALTISDNIIVNLSGSGAGAVLNVSALSWQGAGDADVVASGSGTGVSPSASVTPGYDGESAVAAFAWANVGGAGSMAAPFTQLDQEHSLNMAWLTTGYARNFPAGSPLTASETIVSANWNCAIVTFRAASAAQSGNLSVVLPPIKVSISSALRTSAGPFAVSLPLVVNVNDDIGTVLEHRGALNVSIPVTSLALGAPVSAAYPAGSITVKNSLLSSQVVSLSRNVGAGDAIVLGTFVAAAVTAVSITDTKGNTWTPVPGATVGSYGNQEVWYVSGSQAMTAGVDTITVNYSAVTTAEINVIVIGCTGVPAVGALDQVAAAGGSDAFPLAVTGATAQDSELAVAFETNRFAGGLITWGTGWTQVQGGLNTLTNPVSAMAVKTLALAGSVSAGGILPSAYSWDMSAITLRLGSSVQAFADSGSGLASLLAGDTSSPLFRQSGAGADVFALANPAVGLADSGAAVTSLLAGTTSVKALADSGSSTQAFSSGSVVLQPTFPSTPLGIKLELLIHNVWTDISEYLFQRNEISISGMGRSDWTNQIQAGQMTLTLNNRDGRFTPKNASGTYYPYITRNIQCRLSVNSQSSALVRYNGYRFWGEVSEWPPSWDETGRDIYATITASGIWRRISQSTASGTSRKASTNTGSPYLRYLQNLTGFDVPASAWMMEDGSGSSSSVFVTSIGAGGNMTINGEPSFAQDGTSFPGCDALPSFNGARLAATVSSPATATSNTIRLAISVPAAGDSTASTFADGGEFLKIITTSNNLGRIDVCLVGNKLSVRGYATSAGGTALFTGTVPPAINGVPVLVSVELTPNGSGVNWALRLIKPGATAELDSVTGTIPNRAIGRVSTVYINGQGRISDTVAGALSVHYDVPSLINAAYAIGGYLGEYAIDRFQRICTEFGIPYEVIGTASAKMGPQLDGTLPELLQAIEDTDGGLLYETRGMFGLGYRTLDSLQDQAAAVTLNYAGSQVSPPLSPVYDDQLIRNQWTVSNYDGYTIIATLISGALSVQNPPNGVGIYPDSRDISAYSDSQTSAIAVQRLYQGTVDDVRYPSVTVEMGRQELATLFAAVPGIRIGDYLRISNAPSYGGNQTVNQLMWGYSETLSNFSWSITFNTISEAPFESSFSPGTYTAVRAASSPVTGSSPDVSGSQILPGAIAPGQIGGSLTARMLGGMTDFISATVMYDWSFGVTGTPADSTYFICTEDQAQPITVGDTFTSSLGYGGPFTVTSTSAPYGGYVNVSFTPDATAPMVSGTVYGGKEGDIWINSAADYKLQVWHNGQWQPIQFGPSALSFNAGGVQVTFSAIEPPNPANGDLWYDSANGNQLKQWNGSAWAPYQFGTGAIAAGSVTAALIAANTITATQIAAGTITGDKISSNAITSDKIAAQTITASDIAAGAITADRLVSNITVSGIVDATTVIALAYICNSIQGEFMAYDTASASAGHLINSIAGASGTDTAGNQYPKGLYTQQLTMYNWPSLGPPAFPGSSVFYSSVCGRPRYVSAFGNSSVLERSNVNVSQFTVGNTTTPTLISAPLDYQADEGNQSSEFEIEIDGIITTAGSGTPQTLTFQLAIDGSPPTGAGPVTIGAVFLALGATYSYTIRFRISLNSFGANATAVLSVDGGISRRAANAGSSTTPLYNITVGETGYNKAFDTTTGHTLQVYAFWGGNTAGQVLTTYRTKIARRD